MVSPETRVLVVGTTPDYVHWINQAWPGRAVFITDQAVRHGAAEPVPDAQTELVADLRHHKQVRKSLAAHLRRYAIRLSGITCYDCDALPLAAWLAQSLELPYPSIASVTLCRDKLECKKVWQASGVPCPEASIVSTAEQAIEFQQRVGGACVLKPRTGSGSEYVFLCQSPDQATAAVRAIQHGMRRQKGSRMYAGVGDRIVAEAYVVGDEYSCDFLLEDYGAKIVRLAKKIRLPGSPFGTIHGYDVPAELPSSLSLSHLDDTLQQAARSLGLRRSLCMVDFIVAPDGPVMLELAPRPGGDCLPQLIRHAGGIDMLGMALDVAEGRSIHVPPPSRWKRRAAVRIHARQSGALRSIDVTQVKTDPRVREIALSRQPGNMVMMPPEDYDLWVLGYIIFRPDPARDVGVQCEELRAGVRITIEGAA
jgi:biotin carboxylase